MGIIQEIQISISVHIAATPVSILKSSVHVRRPLISTVNEIKLGTMTSPFETQTHISS